MKSKKPKIKTTLVSAESTFTCDITSTDIRDEMCMREYLRAHMPVAV
jgi:hypothetical protein